MVILAMNDKVLSVLHNLHHFQAKVMFFIFIILNKFHKKVDLQFYKQIICLTNDPLCRTSSETSVLNRLF